MKDMLREEAPSWAIARFDSCLIDRDRRELVRDSAIQPLEPRAFDVLVYLIENRHRVVTKADILVDCLGGNLVSDGALARTIMKIRQAISDFDTVTPLIKTMHRVGYRFVGEPKFDPARRGNSPHLTSEGPGKTREGRRIAVLLFKNDTGDDEYSWVELGLMSLVGKALQSVHGLSIVPVHDVLAVLGQMTAQTTLELCQPVVESRLGASVAAWGRLSGEHGRLLLHFNLKSPEAGVLRGIVAGSDPAKMALDAAGRLRDWLMPAKGQPSQAGLNLGDEFLNEAFGRALQRSRQNRLIEAEHLLDVVRDAGGRGAEVQYEVAKVEVLLGRPNALAEIDALYEDARRTDNTYLRAMSHMLRGTYLHQKGQMAEAAAVTQKAVDAAEAAGLADVAVQCMVACADRLGACFDERSQALLSRAIPRAERLGNQVLLLEAYSTAGRLAGYRNDWISSARHHEIAVSIARNIDETVQSAPYANLAWAQLQLGQLANAVGSACAAFRSARISGVRPELGMTAGVAVNACLANRRIRDAADLFRTMLLLADDRSAAMLVAREVHCRAALLRAAGRYDEALSSIEDAAEATRDHAIYQGYCDSARLQVLLHAGRFDEVEHACASLRSNENPRDPRLEPWIERALALRECFAIGNVDRGLDRMHALIRTTPICDVHARVSMEAAWMHLERGQAAQARRTVEHLPTWLEQSPPGMQVDARLRYAAGDWEGAATVQRRFVQRYAESLAPFQLEVLRLYEQTEQDGRQREIPLLNEAIDMCWQVEPRVLLGLPEALGGGGNA